jgi:sporulation protein YlmC with PRC-barrel domain
MITPISKPLLALVLSPALIAAVIAPVGIASAVAQTVPLQHRPNLRDSHDTASATTATTRSTGDFNVTGQMSAEALIGKPVKTKANEPIGKVSDVYLDANGAVKLVIVSVGGFLGVGAKEVGVPWSDLKFGREGNSISVTTLWTKESLKAMPDYNDQRRLLLGSAGAGG